MNALRKNIIFVSFYPIYLQMMRVLLKVNFATNAVRVVALPCLLICLLLAGMDIRAEQLNGNRYIFECTVKNISFVDAGVGLGKPHLANKESERSAEVSGSDFALLMNKKMNAEAISSDSTNKSANNSKPTANNRKLISGEIHSKAEALFWCFVVGFGGIIIFLIGFYALT